MRVRFVTSLLFLIATAAFGQTVTEVDLSIPAAQGFRGFWFRNFYISPSTGRPGYVAVGPNGQMLDSAVVQGPAGRYLVATMHGLGDVFQLDGTPGPAPAPQPEPVPGPAPGPVPVPPPAPAPRPQCGSMAGDVFVFYEGSSGCSYINSAACSVGEQIAFNALGFRYDFSCATHAYRWSFGDGSPAATVKAPTHAYAAVGTYPVTLTVSSPFETATRAVTVTVGGGGSPAPAPVPTPVPGPAPQPQPCPEPVPPPPCPTCQPCPVCPPAPPAPTPTPVPQPPVVQPPQPQPSSGCPAPVEGKNIFLFISGDTCNSRNGEPCDVGEPITFALGGFPWFMCGSRSFAWDFGDGGTETAESPRHRYARAGEYDVRVVVTVEGQRVTLTQKMSVQ